MKNSRIAPLASADLQNANLFAGCHDSERDCVSTAEGFRIVSLLSIAGWLAVLIAARWVFN